MPAARTSLLFSPFNLRSVTFPNRVVIAPMQMYVAAQDGMATDWHLQHLGKFAVGGAGTVMTEAMFVDPVGRNTYGDLGIWSDAHIPGLRRIVDFLHAQGSLAAAQLHHSGPKSARRRPWDGFSPLDASDAARGEPPWVPVSSTSHATTAGWQRPHQMTIAEIAKLVRDYGLGARRAAEAGFDVLDIHAAHGYLIHSFLSPINNDRKDAYGSDFAGRTRFALEIAEELRRTWPADKPIFFRLSCVDRIPGGWEIEDTIALARALKARGIDLIDCSSGGIRDTTSLTQFARTRQKLRRGYQVPYAEAVRRGAGMPTMAVGAILDGPQAEAILQQGKADLIAIGREALNDPHWALHAAQALGVDPEWRCWPPSYGWWLQMRESIGIVDEEQPSA
jgi:2,4-dienoyl-CoA reductase-like NADH-dependent reductase (Old Yellow Enzyme family)